MSPEISQKDNLELSDIAKRQRDRNHKAIRVIEYLIPNQQELERVPDNELRGLLQQRLLTIESMLASLHIAITKTVPVSEVFNLPEPTQTVELKNSVNIGAPVWVTYETLPQKYGTDFIIEDNILHWVNETDQFISGALEIVYYKL